MARKKRETLAQLETARPDWRESPTHCAEAIVRFLTEYSVDEIAARLAKYGENPPPLAPALVYTRDYSGASESDPRGGTADGY